MCTQLWIPVGIKQNYTLSQMAWFICYGSTDSGLFAIALIAVMLHMISDYIT